MQQVERRSTTVLNRSGSACADCCYGELFDFVAGLFDGLLGHARDFQMQMSKLEKSTPKFLEKVAQFAEQGAGADLGQ
jgi:hypothetical protein